MIEDVIAAREQLEEAVRENFAVRFPDGTVLESRVPISDGTELDPRVEYVDVVVRVENLTKAKLILEQHLKNVEHLIRARDGHPGDFDVVRILKQDNDDLRKRNVELAQALEKERGR